MRTAALIKCVEKIVLALILGTSFHAGMKELSLETSRAVEAQLDCQIKFQNMMRSGMLPSESIKQ
jgi:hypothetical protein